MFLCKYEAMLLLLLVMLAGQSLAASEVIFTEPDELQVSTDSSRAAVVVRRKVTPATKAPPSTTTVGTTTTQQSNAGTPSITTATTEAPQAKQMTGAFEIAFSGIRELDNNSKEVGGASHSFYRFNDPSVSFLSMSKMSPMMTETRLPKNSGSARGKCRRSTADLQRAGSDAPNATVNAELCALESDGTANLGGEAFPMATGQFHMNVDVEGWQWCGCAGQEGMFLEFTFTIAVPAGYKISPDNKMPVKISLGTNDSFILISSKYGSPFGPSTQWMSMSTGYPMVMVTNKDGTGANVTARVPRRQSDSLTVITLVVEPGHTSSEHVKPGPISAAPRYIATPALGIATAAALIVAALLSQR